MIIYKYIYTHNIYIYTYWYFIYVFTTEHWCTLYTLEIFWVQLGILIDMTPWYLPHELGFSSPYNNEDIGISRFGYTPLDVALKGQGMYENDGKWSAYQT